MNDGLCQCGCGGLAPISDRTYTRDGLIKGESRKYINGHTRRLNNEKFIEAFHKKYMTVPECGCWLWIGATSHKHGYGSFAIKRKTHRAHRASWIIHNGAIPKGLYVLHKCDTPACVNPIHLYLGTQQDNINDAIKKGRK